METSKFKTNIKCGGCIAAVSPYLDRLPGIEHWEVDIQDPDKILTIQGKAGPSDQEVISTLEKAGYKAEKLSA